MEMEVIDGLAMEMVLIKSNPSKCRGSLGLPGNTSLDSVGPAGHAVPATIAMDLGPILSDMSDTALFDRLKKEHDLAKAIKNNNAEVPVHLWDAAMWAGAPTWLLMQEGGTSKLPEVIKKKFRVFQQLRVRLYWYQLWKEIYTYLVKKYGHSWVETGRGGGIGELAWRSRWHMRYSGASPRTTCSITPWDQDFYTFDSQQGIGPNC